MLRRGSRRRNNTAPFATRYRSTLCFNLFVTVWDDAAATVRHLITHLRVLSITEICDPVRLRCHASYTAVVDHSIDQLLPTDLVAEQRVERVQALADISRSVLCCHSNETRARIANPLNSAHLHEYTALPTIPKLYPGTCSSVGMRLRTDTQTDTETRVITIHFASSTTHAKYNNVTADLMLLLSIVFEKRYCRCKHSPRNSRNVFNEF